MWVKAKEGKTKIIYRKGNLALIKNKSVITAGDGTRADYMEDKGALATRTTCNCFELLTRHGIPNHFIRRCDEKDAFLARFGSMIPVEIVVREIVFGSRLSRHPEETEGAVLSPPVVELFYKDDARHDPIMIWSEEKHCFELYDAKKPISQETYYGDIQLITPSCSQFDQKQADILRDLGMRAFKVFKEAWAKQGVTLVDLKIECAWLPDGTIVIADVIDNDSWRIWIGGDKEKMMDKEVYRQRKESMESIKENYAWVAFATDNFLA